jgi:hypothetical protein
MSRAFPRGCPWTASPLCEQRAVDEVALFAFSGALVDPMGVVAQEDPRARPAHTWPSPILRLALVALSLIRPAEQGRRSTKSPPRPWSNDRVEAAEASEPSRAVARHTRLDLLCLGELSYVYPDPWGDLGRPCPRPSALAWRSEPRIAER